MRSLPGILVGDMGPKIGYNGVDNGFANFNQVRIPRENLLNKTGDVTPDGKYITPIKVKKIEKTCTNNFSRKLDTFL